MISKSRGISHSSSGGGFIGYLSPNTVIGHRDYMEGLLPTLGTVQAVSFDDKYRRHFYFLFQASFESLSPAAKVVWCLGSVGFSPGNLQPPSRGLSCMHNVTQRLKAQRFQWWHLSCSFRLKLRASSAICFKTEWETRVLVRSGADLGGRPSDCRANSCQVFPAHPSKRICVLSVGRQSYADFVECSSSYPNVDFVLLSRSLLVMKVELD